MKQELKAQAYDLIVQLEQAQLFSNKIREQLGQINAKIAELEKTEKEVEVTTPEV